MTENLDVSIGHVGDTVDGRNPKQPPGMYKNPVNNGINYISTGAGFLPSTVYEPIFMIPSSERTNMAIEKHHF